MKQFSYDELKIRLLLGLNFQHAPKFLKRSCLRTSSPFSRLERTSSHQARIGKDVLPQHLTAVDLPTFLFQLSSTNTWLSELPALRALKLNAAPVPPRSLRAYHRSQSKILSTKIAPGGFLSLLMFYNRQLSQDQGKGRGLGSRYHRETLAFDALKRIMLKAVKRLIPVSYLQIMLLYWCKSFVILSMLLQP